MPFRRLCTGSVLLALVLGGAVAGVACSDSSPEEPVSRNGDRPGTSAPEPASVGSGGLMATVVAGSSSAIGSAGTASGGADGVAPSGGGTNLGGSSDALGGAGAGGVAGTRAAGASSAGSGGRDFSINRDAFFGASRCAASKLQFCEDFEAGNLDAATWKVGGKAPTIDGVQHARGSKALHVAQGKGSSKISTTKPFPAKNGRYWGRAFVYLNAMPHQSASADSLDYSHWTILAATGTGVAGEVRLGGQLMRRYQNSTALNYWGVGTDNRNEPAGSGDWTNSDDDPKGAAKPVVERVWQCLEWMADSSSDETKFFLDAVEHPSLATTPETKHGGNSTKPFLLPTVTTIWFGWTEYQVTTQQFELWFDEIAMDPERIGCVL